MIINVKKQQTGAPMALVRAPCSRREAPDCSGGIRCFVRVSNKGEPVMPQNAVCVACKKHYDVNRAIRRKEEVAAAKPMIEPIDTRKKDRRRGSSIR